MKESVFFKADNVALRNFKGVKDFKGRLDGNCAIIIGSEAVGKSNLLMAISMILKKYPSALVTQGEEEGSVRIAISKGKVKYEFRFNFENGDKEPRLRTIVDGEKITVAKQTEVIKSLIPQSFDLDALINAKGQAQADLILTAFDIDVSKEKEAYKEAFDERKLAKRGLEEASHFEVKEEVKEVDTKALRESLNTANAQNGLVHDAKIKLNSYKERKKELEDELKVLKKRIDEVNESVKKGENYLNKTVIINTEKLEEDLSNAETTNEQARAYKDYLTKVDTKKKKQTVVQKWQTKVQETTKAITDKINSAKLPVPKLSITTAISETSGRITSELTYNGLPFDDSSVNTAERLAIGAKLQMALYRPGNLAIVTINAGSIGDSTIKSISEECEKRGMQCLFELTSRDDKKQLQIETVLKH